MEENHVTGSAKTTGGKVKEDFSRIARDAQAQIKGQGEQVQGAADDLYGQARDVASGGGRPSARADGSSGAPRPSTPKPHQRPPPRQREHSGIKGRLIATA
jgi:uncharacterized protein YjbJ (UPF0337 family)